MSHVFHEHHPQKADYFSQKMEDNMLDYLLKISSLEGGLKIFTQKNYRALHNLCSKRKMFVGSDVELIKFFEILTNLAGHCNEISAQILQRKFGILQLSLESLKNVEPDVALSSAQLIVNLSKISLQEFYKEGVELFNSNINLFLKSIFDGLEARESALFIMHALTNLSTLEEIRFIMHKDEYFSKILAQFSSSSIQVIYCAAKIIYNLSFDDGCHDMMFNYGKGADGEDSFLVAILSPLADINNELSEEETTSLPFPLQYYDKKRSEDLRLRFYLLKTLYQLCSTTIGRTKLRLKSVYPLLRELDRACTSEQEEEWREVLRCVIGILIRTEDDMEIPNNLHSIRNLGLNEGALTSAENIQ